MKAPWRIYEGCTFGDSPENDPCLKTWVENGRKNIYGSGAAIYAQTVRTSYMRVDRILIKDLLSPVHLQMFPLSMYGK